MGRQRAENLHKDRYQKDISEDRRGDRQRRTYIRIDIRKTSLKTDGKIERVENLHRNRYQKDISEDRRGDRKQ